MSEQRRPYRDAVVERGPQGARRNPRMATAIAAMTGDVHHRQWDQRRRRCRWPRRSQVTTSAGTDQGGNCGSRIADTSSHSPLSAGRARRRSAMPTAQVSSLAARPRVVTGGDSMRHPAETRWKQTLEDSPRPVASRACPTEENHPPSCRRLPTTQTLGRTSYRIAPHWLHSRGWPAPTPLHPVEHGREIVGVAWCPSTASPRQRGDHQHRRVEERNPAAHRGD